MALKYALKKDEESKWPLRLFAFCLILMYGSPADLIPVLGSLKLGILTTFALAVFWVKSQQWKKDLAEKEIIINILFILSGAISVFYAQNTGVTLNLLQTQIVYIFGLTLAAMLSLKKVSDFEFWLKLWLCLNVYIALTVIKNGGRGPGGFLSDENDVGVALVMALPYFYYGMQYYEKKLNRGLVMAGFGICFVAIIFTASRGTFLGLVAVLSTIFLLSKRKMILAMAGGVALVLGVALFVSEEYISEMRSISDTEDSTRNERLYSWGLGVDIFLDHPFLGAGVGQYPWNVDYYMRERGELFQNRSLGGRAAHSTYVDLLSEYGLFGVVCFLLLLGGVYKRLMHCKLLTSQTPIRATSGEDNSKVIVRVLSYALVCSFIGFFSTGTFVSVFYYPNIWLAFGLVVALSRLARSTEAETSVELEAVMLPKGRLRRRR